MSEIMGSVDDWFNKYPGQEILGRSTTRHPEKFKPLLKHLGKEYFGSSTPEIYIQKALQKIVLQFAYNRRRRICRLDRQISKSSQTREPLLDKGPSLSNQHPYSLRPRQRHRACTLDHQISKSSQTREPLLDKGPSLSNQHPYSLRPRQLHRTHDQGQDPAQSLANERKVLSSQGSSISKSNSHYQIVDLTQYHDSSSDEHVHQTALSQVQSSPEESSKNPGKSRCMPTENPGEEFGLRAKKGEKMSRCRVKDVLKEPSQANAEFTLLQRVSFDKWMLILQEDLKSIDGWAVCYKSDEGSLPVETDRQLREAIMHAQSLGKSYIFFDLTLN